MSRKNKVNETFLISVERRVKIYDKLFPVADVIVKIIILISLLQSTRKIVEKSHEILKFELRFIFRISVIL